MKFVDNLPLGKDLFEGQSQERIAASISQQLEQGKNRIIGVDGGWGTGKSNVVKIIEKKLCKKNFTFFVYDVWGHQQDLQRRAILEELVSFLINEKLLKDNDNWTKKLKILTGKTVETKVEIMPKVSFGLLLSFILVILLPTITPLAEHLNQTFEINKMWILLLPLFTFILIYLGYLSCALCKVSLCKGFGIALSNMLSVYKDKEIEHSQTEFSHERNPTVIDFSKFIKDISTEIGYDKHIVLVFDNMDRLPTENIKELWASLHILFADKDICPHTNIHVIVPFDRCHINNVFDEGKQTYGDDYINKTFDIVYRVAPPILSDWKNFFHLKWKEAFDETVSEEEYARVLQIFDLLNNGLTPRNIIVFINEIVSIKMIFGGDIPINYIALFVAKKNDILNSEKTNNEIIEQKFLGPLDFIYKNDSDLPKYIAALAYQIPPEKSLQIIYSRQLKDGLENASHDDVLLICKTSEFLDILDSIFHDFISIPTIAISFSMIPDEYWKNNKDRFWNDLYKKFLTYESLPKKQDKLWPYQEAFLKNISDKKEFADKILADMRNSEEFNSVNYYKIVTEIETLVPEIILYLPIKKITNEGFINLLEHAKNDYERVNLIYDSIEKLDTFLAGKQVTEIESVLSIQYVTKEIKPELKKFKEKLTEYSRQAIDKVHLKPVIELMESYFDDLLTHNVADTTVFKLFTSSNPQESFYYSLLAMCISKYTVFPLRLIAPFEDALKQTDKASVEAIVNKITKYTSFGDILLNLTSMNKYPLYVDMVKYIIENWPPITLKLDMKKIFRQFDQIVKDGIIDAATLLSRLDNWKFPTIDGTDIEKIFTRQLLYFMENSETKTANESKKCVCEYLDLLSVSDWESRFSDINELYGATEGIFVNFSWNSATQQALPIVLEKMCDGSIKLGNLTTWNDLIAHMKKKGKNFRATFNQIRDYFVNGQKPITIEQFKFLGAFLLEYATLNDKTESLRHIFPLELFKNDECLEIILDNKEKIPDIIKKAGVEADDWNDFFREKVTKDPTTKLKELFDILGLTLLQKNEDGTTEK